MGYMRHHAIIVTSWDDAKLEAAHAEAVRICGEWGDGVDAGPVVTALTQEAANGYRSFMVAPDGSKEGWAASDAGDGARERLVAYLTRVNAEHGGTYLDWVEVQFGDDDRETKVVRDSYHPLTTSEGAR